MGFLKRMATGPDQAQVDGGLYRDPTLDNNQARLGSQESGLANRPLTQINTAPQDQFRQGQSSLVQALQGQVAGTAPSVAENQLRQGQEANLKQALALAGSARGGGVASNQRTLARNVMDAGQSTNAQAATLRAGEQATAANTLGSVLNSARSSDIGLATSQAQLSVQEQQNRDQLIQQYIQMGLTLDQAQFKASQDLAAMKANIAMGNAQNQQKADAGMLGMLGTLGAAGIMSGGKGGGGAGGGATTSGTTADAAPMLSPVDMAGDLPSLAMLA